MTPAKRSGPTYRHGVTMADTPEPVLRRITVEYGRQYAYLMFTDGNGRVLDEEVWKQPFRLDQRDAVDEAKEAYDLMYSHLQDTVLWTASSDDEGDSVEESPED